MLVEITLCEGVVEVKADKTVTAVVTATVGLDVVVGPVVVVEEHGDGHVVGKLIDVEQGLQFLVGSIVSTVATQLEDALDYHVVAVLELQVLEGIELLVVVTPVGVGKLVVVGLAHIQHAAQLAVHIFNDGLVGLHVDVDARALDDGLQGRIHEAGVVHPNVIATIADEQHLAADVGFLREERIVEAVLAVEHLVRFQLERAETLRACPAARCADVHVLIEEHLAIGTDVAEVDRAVPVAVVVARLILAIAGLAIGAVAVAVEANLRIGEVTLIAHDGDDGQSVLVRGLNVGAGNGHAGQVAVAEQADGEIGRPREGEYAVSTLLCRIFVIVIRQRLPRNVVEVVVVLQFLIFVQVEGDALQGISGAASPPVMLFSGLVGGNHIFETDFSPFGGHVIGAIQHGDRRRRASPPVLFYDVLARLFLGVNRNLGSLVGTHLHAETVTHAGLPRVVGGINIELRL